jgi:hypothetical protein
MIKRQLSFMGTAEAGLWAGAGIASAMFILGVLRKVGNYLAAPPSGKSA